MLFSLDTFCLNRDIQGKSLLYLCKTHTQEQQYKIIQAIMVNSRGKSYQELLLYVR